MQIMTKIPQSNDVMTDEHASIFPQRNVRAFSLVTALFFLWGMSNNLTDILVQQFKKSFGLTPLEAQLVQTSVFFGYFCMALPAAFVMRRWGYKVGILLGLCLFGGGMLIFWPAAVIGKYAPFLVALFVVGAGSAALETAANPFVAQFGQSSTSERRLNFAQAFNPVGTIMGVLLGMFVILSGVELTPGQVTQMKVTGTYAAYLHGEVMRVVPTYVGFGILVLLWALLIGLAKFPTIQDEHEDGENKGRFLQLFHYPNLWLAVLAQFAYVGAQVATWSNLFFYVKQYTSFGERASFGFVLATLLALTVGRFFSTWLMSWFSPAMMIGIYALVNIALIGLAVLHPGMVGACALVATSLFMSIMYPTIFALGLKGLGPNTKLGGAVIVMSIVGGAVLPPLVGYIAGRTGSYALGYLVPMVAYVVVAVYGFSRGPVKHPIEAVSVYPVVSVDPKMGH